MINCRVLDRPLHQSELPQYLELFTFVELPEALTDDVPDIKQG